MQTGLACRKILKTIIASEYALNAEKMQTERAANYAAKNDGLLDAF